jgi:hypothetical protein
MKKIIISIVLLAGLILKPLEASTKKSDWAITPDYGNEISYISRKFYIQTDTRAVLNGLTVYNPTVKQCDKSPLITASNSKIDQQKLRNQEIRWMALSRDLLKRWNGKFHYGDTVLLTSGDASIDGFWIIKDTMNKRYKNQGDLLFDSEVRTLGKWSQVEITRVRSIALSL